MAVRSSTQDCYASPSYILCAFVGGKRHVGRPSDGACAYIAGRPRKAAMTTLSAFYGNVSRLSRSGVDLCLFVGGDTSVIRDATSMSTASSFRLGFRVHLRSSQLSGTLHCVVEFGGTHTNAQSRSLWALCHKKKDDNCMFLSRGTGTGHRFVKRQL